MAAANVTFDPPADRSAIHWQTRLASFKSRGIPDSDPRVVECTNALAFWRIMKVIDDAQDKVATAHLPVLVGRLRAAVAA